MGHPYISPLGKAIAYTINSATPVALDPSNSGIAPSLEDELTSSRRVYFVVQSTGAVNLYFKDPADPSASPFVVPAGERFEMYYAGTVWVSGPADIYVIEAY